MDPQTIPTPDAPTSARRLVNLLAVVPVLAFVALAACQPVGDRDVGYHLAYGERFLTTGRIVDDGTFTWGLDPDTPAAKRFEPGPGNWYDDHGAYRFPNANWLSQVVMAMVYRVGGWTGLSLFSAALITGLAALALRLMCRLGAAVPLAAAATLLIALASRERFTLRPELFGYLTLLLQLSLLAPVAAGLASLTGRKIAALVVIQLLAVNLHSYFLLGMAITAALLAESVLRWLWLAMTTPEDSPLPSQAARPLGPLALLLGLQLAACLANPWTWRLAVLPVQTLLYLREHEITAPGESLHPWSQIIELFPAADPRFRNAPATIPFRLVLLTAAAGALALLRRRLWALLLISAFLALTALQARRNLALGALTLTPLAVGALAVGLTPLAQRSRALPAVLRAGAALLTAAGAAFLSFQVVTQRFHPVDGEMRFGVGPSRLLLPLEAADWINRNKPAGALWTDFDAASNLCFLTRPHRGVPTLTNTWAAPPALMKLSMTLMATVEPFNSMPAIEDYFRRHDVRVVVIRTIPNPASALGMSLLYRLSQAPGWQVARVDPLYVLLLRDDALPALPPALAGTSPARAGAPAPWLDDLLARALAADPVPAESLWSAGRTCQSLAWFNEAIPLLSRCLQLDPSRAEAWVQLGLCHANRMEALRDTDKPAARADHAAALQALDRAGQLGYPAVDNIIRALQAKAP